MEKNYAHIFHKRESGYLKMLKELVLSHPFFLIGLLVLNLFGMLFGLVSPLIMRSLIDDVLIKNDPHLFIPILFSMSMVYIISAISGYYSGYIRGKLNNIFFHDLSLKIFNIIQTTSLIELQDLKIEDLISRTTGNVNVTIQIITLIIPNIIIAILGIFLPFIIMFSMNYQLTLIIMSPIVLFIVSSKYFGYNLKNTQRKALDSSVRVNSLIKESYSIIPLIRIFKLENWMHNRLEKRMQNYCDSSLDVVVVSSLSASVGLLINGVPSILVLGFGSLDVLNNTMSLGTMTAFMGYVALFFSPIQQLSSLWTNYKGSLAAYDRITELLSLTQDKIGGTKFESEITNVTFENVNFSYGNRKILKNFNAVFYQGMNYLIGNNGSGKTTLVKLLSGLYQPKNGRILINETDISEISRGSLSSIISVAFSESFIFDGTIFDNIHIGDLDSSEDDVIQASKKAELHDFVISLPDTYLTEVGESGYYLSSGEKQKIALARVILNDSPIVIFDEFTKSIDIESKNAIYSIIQKFSNKIIIIITHNSKEIDFNRNCIFVNGKDNVSIFNTKILS